MNVLPALRSHKLKSANIWIAGLGYEARSIFAFSASGCEPKCRFAVEFQDNHVLSFDENRDYFSRNEFELVPFIDRKAVTGGLGVELKWVTSFANLIRTHIKRRGLDVETLDVALDVSVMSRDMMALAIESLWNIAKGHPLNLQLVYSPTQFYVPSDSTEPVSFAGPASSFFAGWYGNSELPTAVVLGLGLESARTIWASERFEQARTLLFAPLGYNRDFDRRMLETNGPLFEGMFDERWILDYAANLTTETALGSSLNRSGLLKFIKRQLIPFDVSRPAELFVKLEGTCFSLLKENRVVICPFGPKIFSAVSLLTALAHFPRIAVWRISGSVVSHPEDRKAAGDVVVGAFRMGRDLAVA